MKYKKIVSLCKEEKTVVSSASDSGELTWFGANKALYDASTKRSAKKQDVTAQKSVQSLRGSTRLKTFSEMSMTLNS